jgi:putative addiction module killer protein
MMEIRIYSDEQGRTPLTQWLETMTDIRGRAAIRARLARVQAGNLDDCKPLREGVQELRIDHGPGYRAYLSRQGAVLVLLLCGSD